MKILIIEDDKNKLDQILQVLSANLKGSEIHSKFSYHSGKKAILTASWDVIILDMSLPTYDISTVETGFHFRAFAGRDILGEMKRKKQLVKTIVLTQFETFGSGSERTTLAALTQELKRDYEGIFAGTIYYNASETNWKSELLDKLSPQ